MRSHLEADLTIGAAAAQRVGAEAAAATLLALSEQVVLADASTRTDLHTQRDLRGRVCSAIPARRRRDIADTTTLLQVDDWRGAVGYLAATARSLVGGV
jgi:hypothetical protein